MIIRSFLDYANQFWVRNITMNINSLERVQGSMTNLIPGRNLIPVDNFEDLSPL